MALEAMKSPTEKEIERLDPVVILEEYLLVIAKKSNLSRSKRNLIEWKAKQVLKKNNLTLEQYEEIRRKASK